MRLLLLCLLLYAAVNVQAAVNIEKMITKYFESSMYKTFYDKWQKFRNAIEHAIELNLKETYSDEGMNVYVRRLTDPHRLADGVLVYDNVVNVLFKDPHLMRLPRLTNPEVSFALASNVLRVEASVNRMFIQAGYQLFRNISDVVYGNDKFDPMKMSPFNLQHVRSSGEVTIVAEGCKLTGLLVVTLNERSVYLGQDSIKLVNCLFSVEITTPGLGSPPVIVPYFSKEHGKELEMLLSRPIRDELVPKLQGAVLTLVNTSSLFGDFLPEIRQKQRSMFKYTSSFMSNSIRSINEKTLNSDGGIEKWKDVTIIWSDKNSDGDVQNYKVVLTKMTITGLDSAYTAKNGGPYKIPAMKISETIRFSDLQIRGSLIYNEHDSEIDDDYHLFYGEINDVICTVTLNVQDLKSNIRRQHLKPKSIDTIEVFGWSNLELHAPTLPLIAPHSLISGVILNELPRMIVHRLSQSLTKSVNFAKAEVAEEQQNDNTENGEVDKGSGDDVGTNVEDNDENVQNHGTNHEDNEEMTENQGTNNEEMIENRDTNIEDNEEIVEKNESNGDIDVAGNKPQDNSSDKGKSDKSAPGLQKLIRPKFKASLKGKPMFDTSLQNKSMFVENIKIKPMFGENAKNNPMFGENDKNDKNKPMFGENVQIKPMFGGKNQNKPMFGENDKNKPMFGENVQIKPMFGGNNQNKPMFGKNVQNKPMFGENDRNKPMFGGNNQNKPMFEANKNEPMFDANVFGNSMFGKMSKKDVRNGNAEEDSRSEAAAKRLFQGRKHKVIRKVGVDIENSRYEKRPAYKMDEILSEDNEIRSE